MATGCVIPFVAGEGVTSKRCPVFRNHCGLAVGVYVSLYIIYGGLKEKNGNV